MDGGCTIRAIAEGHFTHSICGTARCCPVSLQLRMVGFVQFEYFHFTIKTRFYPAQPNRYDTAITFHRLNDFDLLHAGSALTNLVWIGEKIPDLFAWRPNRNIAFQ